MYHTKTLEFEDNEYEIIINSLIKGIEFIENNKTTLVHCRQGISRSSAIVIAYIMFKEKKSFIEAENFVKAKKSDIIVRIYFTVQGINHYKVYEWSGDSEGFLFLICLCIL